VQKLVHKGQIGRSGEFLPILYETVLLLRYHNKISFGPGLLAKGVGIPHLSGIGMKSALPGLILQVFERATDVNILVRARSLAHCASERL
jgi:hypothetical protein